MNSYLRQSTASQSRALGPFVDSSNVPATGLSIANTDIKIVVNGAASVNKNSGGGTHRVNGVYGVTWDATDTATVGEMEVSVYVAGALVVFATYTVLEEAQYDSLFGAALLSLDGSGNVLMALGKLSITPASGVAVEILGQGSGAGVRIVGGATGKGLEIIGGATSGNGVHISTTNGVGLNVVAAGTVAVQLTTSAAASALSIVGGASATAAVYILGGAGSEGLRIVGGTDSDGVRIHGGGADGVGLQVRGGTAAIGVDVRGGSTSGDGIKISATSGQAVWLESASGLGLYVKGGGGNEGGYFVGDDAPGVRLVGGDTAAGLHCQSGVGNGAGIFAVGGTTGPGIEVRGGGSDSIGLWVKGSGTGAGMTAVGGGSGVPLNIETVRQITDELLKRDWTAITGESARSLLNAARLLRNHWEIVAGILTVTKEDDSTTAWQAAIATTPGAVPITGSDPT
jgi:hypothetical protein